jgi:hypothetical protein
LRVGRQPACGSVVAFLQPDQPAVQYRALSLTEAVVDVVTFKRVGIDVEIASMIPSAR